MKGYFVRLKIVTLIALSLLLVLPATSEGQSRRDRQRAEQLYNEGNRAFNQRDYRNAVIKYAESVMLVPTNAATRFWKGMCHFHMDQMEMALSEFDSALSLGYERPVDVYRIRWRIHYVNKNYTAAASDVENGLELDPDNLEFLIAKGDMSFVGGRYKEALDLYQRALVRAPNNGELHLNVAKIHYQLDDPQAVTTSAQEAINKGTQSPGVAFLLIAEANKALRKYPEAIDAYNRAQNLDPKNYDVYRNLADLYRIQNRFDDAIRISRQALTIFPNDGNIYTDLSWYYSLAERHEEAAEAARAGIRFAPEEHMAYTNLCRALNDLKKPELAIRECNNALKIKPNDGETNFYLGFSHTLLNRHDDAARYYRRAVSGLEAFTRENRNYSDGFYLLGNAYLADNQAAKAVDAYRNALDLSPRFARARYNLAVAYLMLKRKSDATEQYKLLIDIDPALAATLKAEIDRS